jgi:SAM-dependent methyltransferase
MNTANQEQADHWNRSDDLGHWITRKDQYDRMLAPFDEMILDGADLAQGGDVLDIGCGSGATTLAAARRIAPGRAVGLDLSVQMLERARTEAKNADLTNALFERGDAQVFRFDTSFNSVISRFGLMFFADPVEAFTNLRSACRPDGRLVFVCWQSFVDNEWLLVPGAALAEHVPLPDFGTGDRPGMFALADADRIRQQLAGAGWHDITVTSRHTPLLLGGGGSIDETLDFLRTGSMGRMMLDGVGPETEARAVESVRRVLETRADGEGVRLDAAVWLVQASA